MRPAGDVLLELEPLLFELVDDQGLQLGELLALVKCWTEIHAPHAIEEYTADDTSPIYFYGPREALLKRAKIMEGK